MSNNTIQIKRNTSGAPSSLDAGELAVNLTDKKLWVGNNAGDGVLHLNDHLPLAGGTLTGNLTVGGNLTIPQGNHFKLDGGSDTYIYSDTSDSIAFNTYNVQNLIVRTTGVTVGGSLKLNDNVKANFGTGNDLEIYHDGADARIRNATGTLKIQATSNGENGVMLTPNGKTSLYYDGIEKFETTSTGATVTGNLSVIYNGSASVRTYNGVLKSDFIENSAGANNLTIRTESGGNKNVIIDPDGTGYLNVKSWSVFESSTNFASIRLKSTAGEWDIDNNNGTFGLQWAGGDKLTLSNSGNLTVGGDATIGGAATKLKTYSDITYSGIYNGSSLFSDEAIYFGAGSTYFKNDGATSLTISAAGTVTVSNNLTVASSCTLDYGANPAPDGTDVDVLKIGSTVGSGYDEEFRIKWYSGTGDLAYIGSSYTDATAGNDKSYLAFGTRTSDVVSERLRIAHDGGVGIGLGGSDPSTKLDVYHATDSQITVSSDSDSSGDSSLALIERSANSAFGSANTYGFQWKYDGGDNKLYLTSGNQTSIVNRLTVERDTGNVGIGGTTAPNYKLQVAGTFRASDSGYFAKTSGTGLTVDHGTSFGTIASDIHYFKGNVGIGDTSPAGLLSLAKGTRTLDIKLETSPATGDMGVQFRAGSGDYLGLAAGGGTGTGIIIDDSNRVGIGGTPSGTYTKLHVVGTTFIDATETTGGLTVKATSNANITLQTAQNSAYHATLAAHYSYTTPMTLSGYGGTVLAQNTGVTKTLLYANNAEQIRITTTGVGIGLGGSDPSAKLHVAGSAIVGRTNTTGAYPNDDYDLFVGNGNSGTRILLFNNSGNYHSGLIAYDTNCLKLGLNNSNSADSLLTTTAVNITNTGVGIGGIPGLRFEVKTSDSASTQYGISVTNPNNQASNGGGAGIRFSTSGGPGASGNEANKYSSIEAFDVDNWGSHSGLSFTTSNSYNKTKAMVLDRNGRCGIGVTDPDSRLEIKGAGASTGLTLKTTDSSGNTGFWAQDGGKVGVHYYPFVVNQDYGDTDCPSSTYMYVHSASPFIIKNDGKVGIGSTAPTNKFTVAGGSQYTKAYLSQTADIHIANTSGGGVGSYAGAISFCSTDEANLQAASIAAIQTGSDQNQIGLTFNTQVSTAGSTDLAEAVRIRHDGSVGIGVDPSAKLHVTKTGVGDNEIAEVLRLSTLNSASPSWGYQDGLCIGAEMKKADGTTVTKKPIKFRYDGGDMATTFEEGKVGMGEAINPDSTLQVIGPNAVGKFFQAQNQGASGVEFKRVNASSAPYNHYLFHNGFVGIATNAPNAPLQVVGGAANNNDTANVLSITGSEHVRAIIDTSSTGGHQASLVLESNSNEVSLATTGSNEMRFSTSGSERMRIIADGAIGIGSTNPQDKLNIHDSSSSANLGLKITRGSQTHGLRLGVNDSHAFLWTDQSQDLAFANNNTARLTIKASTGYVQVHERLGVGTASPSAKIHVVASSNDGIRINSNNAIIGQKTTHGSHGTQLLFWNGTDAYLGRSISGLGNGTVTSWNIRTGGADKVIINSTGLGIGGIAPGHFLDVYGSENGTWLTELKNTHPTNGYGLVVTAGDDADVKVVEFRNLAETSKFIMFGNGNCSVGSTASGYGRLFVDATSNANGAAALAVRGRSTDASYIALNVMNSGEVSLLSILNNGTSKFTGLVGINKTVSGYGDTELEVNGNVSGKRFLSGGAITNGTYAFEAYSSVFETASMKLTEGGSGENEDPGVVLSKQDAASTGDHVGGVYFQGTSDLNYAIIRGTCAGSSKGQLNIHIAGQQNTITRTSNDTPVFQLGEGGLALGGTPNDAVRLQVTGTNNTPANILSTSTSLNLTLGSATQTYYTDILLKTNSGNAQVWKAGSTYTSYGGASSLNIYNSNGKIAFHPSGNENEVVINTDGDVDIAQRLGVGGAHSGSYQLYVNGPSYFTASGSSYAGHFKSTQASTPYGIWSEEPSGATPGYPLLYISNSGGSSAYFRVDSGGSVNIGSSKLKIGGSSGSDGQVLTTNGSGGISWTTVSGSGSGTVSSSTTTSGTTSGEVAIYTADTTVKQAGGLIYNGSDDSLTIGHTSSNTTARLNVVSSGSGSDYVAGDVYIQNRIGVGSNPSSSYTAFFGGNIYANGDVGGYSKSFRIPHPTKEGMNLRHSSLEGPEIGVYQRGEIQGDTILLPDYWVGLVRDGTVTVQLTPKGSYQKLFVISASNIEIKIGEADGNAIDCYFTVYGERADIDSYDVEYEGEI